MAATEESQAERWALVTARDIMRTDVVVVSYAAPLSDIEQTLSDNRISGAPVVDAGGHIIGIVSTKDIIDRYAQDPGARPRRGAGFYRLSSEELDEDDWDSFELPSETEDTARDIMTAEVYAVDVNAGLKDIAKTMHSHRIHRVLVQDDGKYVGLISTMEILAALSA